MFDDPKAPEGAFLPFGHNRAMSAPPMRAAVRQRLELRRLWVVGDGVGARVAS